MYHDVLLAKEVNVILDIAHVQSYLNNGNRVVYIDRRAQARSKVAPNAKACAVCDRTLQEPYRFCSIFCRLAFDKHPAAVDSVPVPDGTPLPCTQARGSKSGVGDVVVLGNSKMNDVGVNAADAGRGNVAAMGVASTDLTRSHGTSINGQRVDGVMGGDTMALHGSKRSRKGSPRPSLVQIENGLVMK